MKKSDWATVILIVFLVGVASYFIINMIFPVDTENPTSVPTATKIQDNLTEPSKSVYNEDAINPTVRASIGEQSSKQPFDLGSK